MILKVNQVIIHIYIVLVWTVENASKKKTMTENFAGARVCGMRIEFHLRHNEQYYRFRKF